MVGLMAATGVGECPWQRPGTYVTPTFLRQSHVGVRSLPKPTDRAGTIECVLCSPRQTRCVPGRSESGDRPGMTPLLRLYFH